MPHPLATIPLPVADDLTMGGLLLDGGEGTFVRIVSILGLLSLLGVLGFMTFVLPAARTMVSDKMWLKLRYRTATIAWISALWGVLAGWLGLMVAAVRMLGPTNVIGNTGLLLRASHPGHVVELQSFAVLLCLLALRRLPVIVAFSLAAFATMLCIPSLPLDASAGLAPAVGLHLAMAGLWFGGLLPLRGTLRLVQHHSGAVLQRTFRLYGIANAAVFGVAGIAALWLVPGATGGFLRWGYGLPAVLEIAGYVVLVFLVARGPTPIQESEDWSYRPKISTSAYTLQAMLGVVMVSLWVIRSELVR